MKIQLFNNMAFIASTPHGPIQNGDLVITICGMQEDQAVRIYKDGMPENAKSYHTNGGKLVANVTPGRYALCVGDDKVRFTAYETPDKKIHVKRTKEDPEKTLQKMLNLCIEMMREIGRQNEKIENLSGYDTE